jgi:hypothetical protein
MAQMVLQLTNYDGITPCIRHFVYICHTPQFGSQFHGIFLCPPPFPSHPSCLYCFQYLMHMQLWTPSINSNGRATEFSFDNVVMPAHLMASGAIELTVDLVHTMSITIHSDSNYSVNYGGCQQ